MNAVDRLVTYLSPQAGIKRAAARAALARYEAAEPSRMRRFYKRTGNQNEIVQRYGKDVLFQVRHLSRNHDLARGALRTMVNNVAGSNGIGVEPQPRTRDGAIHKEYARTLRDAYKDWCLKPEITHTMTMPCLHRAMVRSWLRDGEIFGQFIEGFRSDLNHGTRVPLSIEAFETDLVPYENDERQGVVQGIERNTWGQRTALHVYKTDNTRLALRLNNERKVIPWSRVLHVASLDHIGQLRGISEFASVITRLEDIKDYEESERVAAKVAAMLTAYIRKGTPDAYVSGDDDKDSPREINFEAATIIDDLLPGEEIGLIDGKRPNPNLITFRQGQLRAGAAGIGASYSSISKDYNGTYSAQRQELVEQWVNYAVLVDEFVGAMVQPTYKRFVNIAELSGVVQRPSDVDPLTADDALFVAQSMPWIDPLKEALGWEALVKAGFASEVEVIRRRGGNPSDLIEQIKAWRDECTDKELVFSSNEAALDSARQAIAGGGQE